MQHSPKLHFWQFSGERVAQNVQAMFFLHGHILNFERSWNSFRIRTIHINIYYIETERERAKRDQNTLPNERKQRCIKGTTTQQQFIYCPHSVDQQEKQFRTPANSSLSHVNDGRAQKVCKQS